MADLALVGGSVWTEDRGFVAVDLVIEAGRIVGIVPSGQVIAETRVDVTGLTVMPGVIDAHIHLGHGRDISRPRVPSDAASETAAAAMGGVTCFLSYVLSAEAYGPIFADLCAIAQKGARIDFGFHCVIATEEQLLEVPWLVAQGAPTAKLFMNIRGDEGMRLGLPGTDDGYLFRLLEALRDAGGMLCPHPENIEVSWILRDRVMAMDPDGNGGLAAWNATRPPFVEAEALSRVAYLARITGTPVHAVHTSSAEALTAALRQREAGSNVSIETCIQYLTHDTDSDLGSVGKVNPPLRAPEDRAALWDAIRKGQIDTIATDHIHRPIESKDGGIWKAQPGFPGLDTFLPALITEAKRQGVGLETLVPLVTANPARRMGLDAKGHLTPGADADIVVLDLNARQVVERGALASDAGYSIHEGETMEAAVVHTLSRGRFVLRDGALDADAVGHGRYVARKLG